MGTPREEKQQDKSTKTLDNFQRVQVDKETGLLEVTSKSEPDQMMMEKWMKWILFPRL